MKSNAIMPPEWLSRNAIYQINPRTFSVEGTIEAIIKELPFIKELGFNIIYLCPIFEVDTDENLDYWSPRQKASETNNPKNPYRMNDYFSIDEEYGTMDDLKKLTASAHELEMKVLLDLVYAHIGPRAPILGRYPEFAQQNEDGSFVTTVWNFPALDFKSEGLREYLYCNMVYYIAVTDADGFRLDVGDAIPVDFWKEARRRIHCIKKDAILINEGIMFENLAVAFDSCYCFDWHELVRNVYCADESASQIKSFAENLATKLPPDSMILRDIDNHDTVTDWTGRTEAVAGHDGMEQIQVMNYLIDGIPMVYSGNELACEANLNMFANRFHMGKYEVTNRENKSGAASVRRQEIMKALNSMKGESDLLRHGKTEWLETSSPDSVVAFKRTLNSKELLFVGNAKNSDAVTDVSGLVNNKKCILHNGEHIIKDNLLYLKPYEYAVFE